MIYTPLTKKAIKLAYERHAGQEDKSGLPYIHHPLHLAEQMKDENSTLLALIHDLIEDTETTYEELEKMGIPNIVLDALKLLTKPEGVDYLEYVRTIKANELAAQVKKADLMHNSDLTRIGNPTEKDYMRVEKYRQAIEILESYN